MRRPDLSGERPAGDNPAAAREHRHTDPRGQPEVRPDQGSAAEGRRDKDRSERPDWLAARLARLAASLPSAPGYLSDSGPARRDAGTAERLPGSGGQAAPDRPAAPDHAAADRARAAAPDRPAADGERAASPDRPRALDRPAADGRVAGCGDTPDWPGGRAGGHDAGADWIGEPKRVGPLTSGDGPGSSPAEGDRSGSAVGDGSVHAGADGGAGAAGPDADLRGQQPDLAAPGDDPQGQGPGGSGAAAGPGQDGGAGGGGSGGSEWLAGGSRRRAGEPYLPWFMSGQAPEPWFSEDPGAAPG